MNLQPGKTAVDYLIVGHIARDIVEKEFRLGGTAVYRWKKMIESAQVASALAAISVTRPGIEGIPTEAEIQSNQEVY